MPLYKSKRSPSVGQDQPPRRVINYDQTGSCHILPHFTTIATSLQRRNLLKACLDQVTQTFGLDPKKCLPKAITATTNLSSSPTSPAGCPEPLWLLSPLQFQSWRKTHTHTQPQNHSSLGYTWTWIFGGMLKPKPRS